MKAITEENTQSKELNADLQTKEKLKSNRPNIDHLIKRILTERRKEKKKNILIFVFVLLIVFGSMVFSYYN
tara:strand:- start:475 stop:687 length:213 start_codon:yes stop_codon:yes gene_type:complete